ncbi:unnamed protein product [Dimorphilus gyrociliatus]|uniref:Sulfotransferase domain-containing protein n=1 Tax=Dimorphilus gyrociliatus TaxID=2664684 RepID=A0A7I8VHK7_9ANNE|nr:unnamed protein product [Dimorphilus gyrociliatus]
MPSSRDGQLTVEKTPSYFIKSSIPRKVYEMSPRTKLILVVRDPVTRAISDYAQLASRWGKDTKSFDRLAFLNDTKIVNASWAVIKIGLYYKHLARWRRYFSDKQIHLVSGEKLVSQPAAELAKIEKYLGLEPYIHEKHFYFNHTKGFPCLKKKARCLHSSKGRPHPNIDTEVIERLRDFYKPFNYKFYAMTGIDFGW